MVPSQITDHHRQRSAVVYLRSATLEPTTRTLRFRQDLRKLRKLGRQWGWPRSQMITIQDWGVSGLATVRPGFQRLLTEMEAGRVGLVLVSDFSRLGRDRAEIARFMITARQHNVLIALGQQVVGLQDLDQPV